jgi:hypothetical protein
MTRDKIRFLNSARISSTLKTISLYGLAFLPVIWVLSLKYFLPQLLDNEAGKLVSTRQVFEPSFLSRDWAVARGSGDSVFDLPFALLIAPLWLCLRNCIFVALAARLLCWTFLLAALVKLSRTLTIEWYALSCTLFVWICNDQSLGAAEWIFRGAEAKCLAYALFFLAIDATLRSRLWVAGACCGLAIWCHFLVGAWGSVALVGALLLRYRDYGGRRIAQLTALVVGACAPVAVIAVGYATQGTSAQRHAANRMAVSFSDPFHLDPSCFGGWQEFVVASVLAVIAAWVFFKVAAPPHARLMSSFLAMLILIFLAGLLAWQTNQFWFLKSFPFRVPDVLVFLFFMLALPCFVGRLIAKLAKQLGADCWMCGLRASSWHSAFRLAFFFCLLFIVFAGVLRDVHGVLQYDLPVFASRWQQYLDGRKSSWQQMTEYIRDHTPQSAIIMAPPWEFSFWLDAERAQVVNFKRPPHNVRLLEWHRRLTAMNGGPFRSRGFQALEEIKSNYSNLSPAQIEAIRNMYGADYYLTTRQRSDLRGDLIHVCGSYYLYRLSKPEEP